MMEDMVVLLLRLQGLFMKHILKIDCYKWIQIMQVNQKHFQKYVLTIPEDNKKKNKKGLYKPFYFEFAKKIFIEYINIFFINGIINKSKYILK